MRREWMMGSAAVAAMLVLAGCSGGKGGVLAGRNAPDEFLVSRRAPLTIPPDFALSPPKPGAPRPQEADSSQQALSAMFGGAAPRSISERSVIDRTGTVAEAGIRSTVGDAKTVVANKGQPTRAILAAAASTNPEASVTLSQ